MPIVAYQFTFEANTEAAASRESSRDWSECGKPLAAREWLVLMLPGRCNVFLFSGRPRPLARVEQVLRKQGMLPETAMLRTRQLEDIEAIRYFLRLATGAIDDEQSPLLMETLHTAFARATEAGHIGPHFHRLFQRGIWLHERARQETHFFDFSISPARVMVEISAKILGSLSNRKVAVWGEDRQSGRVEQAFREAGCRILSPPPDLNTRPLPGSICEGDILILYPGYNGALDEQQILNWHKRKKGAPFLIFDLGQRELNLRRLRRADTLYLYRSEDVEKVIRFNRQQRSQAVGEIRRWIEEEIEKYIRWRESEDRHQFGGIIGSTPEMQQVFELISRIARTDITVLIDGESGTGKELVARAIHRYSSRADKPFQPINCGAIPENLLESELFGHARGAFTGAVQQKDGLFQIADGGAIFLDEVGELPPHLQVKILRFLQEGEIKPVGSNETIRVNVRVLAATNQDLVQMVKEQRFRSDLYYRLNVIQLTIPPLRDRKEDIPLLTRHFIRKYALRIKKEVGDISAEALSALQNYDWPGNVRELENVIERSVALAVGRQITRFNLPDHIQHARPAFRHSALGERLTLKELEKRYILETLDACGWNYEKASKILDIGRTTLWRKLRQYKMAEN